MTIAEQQLEELISIANKHKGVLHPEDVVQYARNEDSALHSAFEWNDEEAAELYRIEQARRLIRVMVQVVPHEGTETTVQAFVALRSERYENAGYRYFPEVMSTEEGRNDVLETAIWELRAFQKKYKEVKALAEVFEVIEHVIEKCQKRKAS